jgi:predicted Zn finger-like uncharacterized protein
MTQERIRCIRCGSDKTLRGVIYDVGGAYKQQLTFISTESVHSVELVAIFCRRCGHTELIGDTESVQDGVRIKCPYCGAIYSYRSSQIYEDLTVRCQNCGQRLDVPYAKLRELEDPT